MVVAHGEDEDIAALYAPQDHAGSGQLLAHQETMTEPHANASVNDKRNTIVQQSFRGSRGEQWSSLPDRQSVAFFKTFRIPLLLPSNFFGNDPTRYAIRENRIKPSEQYAKSIRVAHYLTLGSSTTDYQNWETCEGSCTVGDINANTNSTHSLQAAIAATWNESETLETLASSSDFGADILEPPEPAPPRPPRWKAADEAADKAHAKRAQVAKPVGDSEDCSMGEPAEPDLPPAAKRRPSSSLVGSPRRAPSRRASAVSAHVGWRSPIEQESTQPFPRAPSPHPGTRSVNEEDLAHVPSWVRASTPRDEHIRAEISLAAAYDNVSFEHRDLHHDTGQVTTLQSVIIGATVYPDAFDNTATHRKLIAQASDGTTRLMDASEVHHYPALSARETRVHAPATLRLPPITPELIKHLTVNDEHLKAVTDYAAELLSKLERRNAVDDKYTFECSLDTTNVTFTRTTDQTKQGILACAASSLIDLNNLLEPQAEAHEEPQDRAINTAMLEIPVGLSDAPSNIREAMRREDWPQWLEACHAELKTR